jgi:hypothetical protein
MIVMVVAPPIGCKVIVAMVGMRLFFLRLPRQKGCMQEARFEEFKKNNGFALLHHIVFCKEEW